MSSELDTETRRKLRGIDIEACDRLKMIKDAKKLSWKLFAEETGVKESTLRQISSHNLKLSRKMCEKICQHYRDVSFEWLLLGNGDMFVDELDPANAHKHYYGWTSKQLIQMLEEKDQQIDTLKSLIETKDLLIQSLKDQISLMKELSNPSHGIPNQKANLAYGPLKSTEDAFPS